jgi:hypothetical protein
LTKAQCVNILLTFDVRKMPNICLEDLKSGKIPGITMAIGGTFCEAAVVCLNKNSHETGVSLDLKGIKKETVFVNWTTPYDERLERAYCDQNVSTEFGAYGIAILLALRLTEYTVIEKTRGKNGFDYWLGKKSTDDEEVFNPEKTARLEISGIFNGDVTDVNTRKRIKIKQTDISDKSGFPAYIAIVEFSKPLAHFEKK